MSTTLPRPLRPPLWSRAPRTIERAVYAILATAFLVDVVVTIVVGSPLGAYIGVALTGLGALTVRRSRWIAMALVVIGPVMVSFFDGEPTGVWSISCFVALLLALRGSPALVVGGIIAAGNVAAVIVAGTDAYPVLLPVASVAGFAALLSVAAGSALRSQGQYWSALEQRARDAETSRRLEIRRGIADERLRIARDLHDSVGHQIAVVSLYLGSAEVRLPAGAEKSREDLQAARSAVQGVLRETQGILVLLRGDETDGLADPLPDDRGISSLIETYRAAGLDVQASIDGMDQATPHVRLALYRIAQEALTNAQRYAGGRVSVAITADDDGSTTMTVINAITARPVAPEFTKHRGGNGLIGIRERAAFVGGTVTIHDQDGRFSLSVTVPRSETTSA